MSAREVPSAMPNVLWRRAREEHPSDEEAAGARYLDLMVEHGHVIQKDGKTLCGPCARGRDIDEQEHADCIDPMGEGECCCDRNPASTTWGDGLRPLSGFGVTTRSGVGPCSAYFGESRQNPVNGRWESSVCDRCGWSHEDHVKIRPGWSEATGTPAPFWPGIDTVFVRSVLDRITYKPGWHFGLDVAGDPRRLYLFAWTDHDIDSVSGERREVFDTAKRWPIDWPPQAHPNTEAQVVAWVRHAVHEWEAHEVNEWLCLDGARVHDPHACHQCLIGGCRA